MGIQSFGTLLEHFLDDVPLPDQCGDEQQNAYWQHHDVVDDNRPHGDLVIPHLEDGIDSVEIVLEQIDE